MTGLASTPLCALATADTLLVGCQDTTVVVIRLADIARHCARSPGETPEPPSVALAGRGDAAWPAGEGRLPCRYLTQHMGAVNCLVRTDTLVFSGSCGAPRRHARAAPVTAFADGTVNVWSASDLSHQETLRGHEDSVTALVVCKQQFLLSGSNDGCDESARARAAD